MKPKLLTKRQQLGIFNTPNAVELMREYVSYSKDVLFVAQKRMHTASLEKFVSRREDERPVTEMQKQMFLNLSEADANEIYFQIRGHIYPETLDKMLDSLPKEVSKELLLQYGAYCTLQNETLIKALDVLGQDAKEFILGIDYLEMDVFNKIFRVYKKDGVKKILIEMPKFRMEHEVELKILRIYSNEYLKEILKNFVSKLRGLGEESSLKIFEIFEKKEVKVLLEQAIGREMSLWYSTLDKIVTYFPKEEARALLSAFFKTGPGRNYKPEEQKEFYKALRKKK